jgi:hypothetical protein
VLDPLASGKPVPSQAVLHPPARACLPPVARLHPPTSRRPSHLLPPSPAPTASLRQPGAGHGLHFLPLLVVSGRATRPYPQTATRRAAHPSTLSQAAQLAPPYRLRQQAHASRPPAASSHLPIARRAARASPPLLSPPRAAATVVGERKRGEKGNR